MLEFIKHLKNITLPRRQHSNYNKDSIGLNMIFTQNARAIAVTNNIQYSNSYIKISVLKGIYIGIKTKQFHH